MSTMLFLAHEYHNDFAGGVLANANCGGISLQFESIWGEHFSFSEVLGGGTDGIV